MKEVFKNGLTNEPYARIVKISEDHNNILHIEVALNGPILADELKINTTREYILYVNKNYTGDSIAQKGKPYNKEREIERISKKEQMLRGEGASHAYALLTQGNNVSISEKEMFIHIKKMGVRISEQPLSSSKPEQSQLTPQQLNEIYSNFLELFPRANLGEIRGIVSSLNARYCGTQKVNISTLVEKYNSLLEQVPGFYVEYNACVGEYMWCYEHYNEVLLIPTKEDGKNIVGITLRSVSDTNTFRYRNFSSSKRTKAPYELYPTKAFPGYNLQLLSKEKEVLWITEGLFKADACYILPQTTSSILGIKQPDAVLSISGVNGSAKHPTFTEYKEIFLIVDNDYGKENVALNKSVQRMLKEIKKVNTRCTLVITPENENKNLKGIDDLVWSIKNKE